LREVGKKKKVKIFFSDFFFSILIKGFFKIKKVV